jgi:hypothetical protein
MEDSEPQEVSLKKESVNFANFSGYKQMITA